MPEDEPGTLLPLLPLADVVQFPHTDLKLHVLEPRYGRMVRDVMDQDEDEPRIGVVVLKPGAARGGSGRLEIFPGGTASRVVDADFLPDGGSTVLLHGEFRFEVTRELAGQPYRQGLVRPIDEPRLNEGDAGIVVVKGTILAMARLLAAELGERFPLREGQIEELGEHCSFEALVNRLAALIDLPVLRKLKLLNASVPDRALAILEILRGRHAVFEMLRPYRVLAERSPLN